MRLLAHFIRDPRTANGRQLSHCSEVWLVVRERDANSGKGVSLSAEHVARTRCSYITTRSSLTEIDRIVVNERGREKRVGKRERRAGGRVSGAPATNLPPSPSQCCLYGAMKVWPARLFAIFILHQGRD